MADGEKIQRQFGKHRVCINGWWYIPEHPYLAIGKIVEFEIPEGERPDTLIGRFDNTELKFIAVKQA